MLPQCVAQTLSAPLSIVASAVVCTIAKGAVRKVRTLIEFLMPHLEAEAPAALLRRDAQTGQAAVLPYLNSSVPAAPLKRVAQTGARRCFPIRTLRRPWRCFDGWR